jgi:uncharacterized protein
MTRAFVKVSAKRLSPCVGNSIAKTLKTIEMSPLAHIFVLLIRAYQWTLSPFFGTQCRFHPTCSHYAVEAIQKHGAIRGGLFTSKRLLRCHPWCDGGFDPVP